MHIPLPMFMLRRIVRRNPWLLADNGSVTRSQTLVLGPLELQVEAAAMLTPVQKAKLQTEANAGTLFG